MNLVSSKSLIAIIGGLDAKANPLADVWLMDLIHYKWCRVQTEPNLDMFFGGLYKHASASNSTSIYVMGGKYLKDIGNSNFWRIDIDHSLNEKKSKGKRLSQVSKISSIWSINPSSHYIKTNDKIIYDWKDVNFIIIYFHYSIRLWSNLFQNWRYLSTGDLIISACSLSTRRKCRT